MKHNRRKDWTWPRVKAALEDAGSSLSAVAGDLNITRFTVANTKRRPNPRVQAAIANIIGQEPKVIWPTRYTSKGRPVIRSQWMQNRPPPAPRHVNSAKAA